MNDPLSMAGSDADIHPACQPLQNTDRDAELALQVGTSLIALGLLSAPAPTARSNAGTRFARQQPLNPGLDAKRASAEEASAPSALSFALHAGASLVALGLFVLAVATWAAAIEGRW